MGNEEFAGYFLLTGGTSLVKSAALDKESAADAYSSEASLNTGGEFGFAYTTGREGWRFGFEVIKPSALSGVSATQGGAEIYQVKSDVSVYAPKVGLEFLVKQTPTGRVILFGYVGSGSLSLKNDYTLVTIAPNANFSIEGKGAANLMGGGLAGEFHMMDTTTVIVEVGYRSLSFSEINYSKDVAAGFNGAIVSGARMVGTDGLDRKLDFTGAYASVGFRFWMF